MGADERQRQLLTGGKALRSLGDVLADDARRLRVLVAESLERSQALRGVVAEDRRRRAKPPG